MVSAPSAGMCPHPGYGAGEDLHSPCRGARVPSDAESTATGRLADAKEDHHSRPDSATACAPS